MIDEHDLGAEVRRTLETLCTPGDVVELRVFNNGRTGSCYYTDFDKLINDVVRHEREKHPAYQWYITLNKLDPQVAARRHTLQWGKGATPSTMDSDVTRRLFIYVDFDPMRASGISATDKEKERARVVMERTRHFLMSRGFPDPITADSGNGYWLIYRVDLAANPENNDRDNAALHKAFLRLIDTNVEHVGVEIDFKVTNASRIVKLFGTVARKGLDTIDRPHRPSRLLDIPAGRGRVTTDQLKEIAAETDIETATPQYDVAKKLEKWDLSVLRVKEEKIGRRYVLKECPFDPAHDRGEAWVFQFENGALAFGCQHDSCKRAGHDWYDLRALMEPGYVRPKTASRLLRKWWNSVGKKQNHENVAALFAEDVKDRLCYSYELGRWMRYNGAYWEIDPSDGRTALAVLVNELIVMIRRTPEPEFKDDELRTAKQKLQDWQRWHAAWLAWITRQNNAHAQEGILKNARDMLRVLLSDFDSDDYLLNCKNITVDLRTGEALDHNPEHKITLMIPVNYNPAARYKRWDRFLAEAVGRYQYVRYLQKEMGYCLTGSTKEELIIVLYGEELAGKSTFYEPVMNVLGAGNKYGYSHYMKFETLKQAQGDGGAPREDLLRLRTCRAVMCSEINKKTIFDTALSKKIASGEPIVARGQHARDSMEYVPRFKVVLGTNYRPVIPFDDGGSYRRFKVHPFVHRFEGKDRDKNLKDDFLTNEAAQERILAWMIEGCLLWQREGLDDVPREVERANEEYRKSQNPLSDFLEEYCILDPDGAGRDNPNSRLSVLLEQYNQDASYYGNDLLKEAAFGKYMKAAGFPGKKTTDKNRQTYYYFDDVRLKSGMETSDGLEFYDLVDRERQIELEMLARFMHCDLENLMLDACKSSSLHCATKNEIKNTFFREIGNDQFFEHQASTHEVGHDE